LFKEGVLMSADLIVQLIEYRYWILGAVALISLLAMGLLGKLVKGVLKWVLIIGVALFALTTFGVLSSDGIQYFFSTFAEGIENFNFEEAVLNSPT
jgi:hypothetical protein